MAAARPGRPPRVEGRRVAIAFGILLVVGTVVATVAAMYGHVIGAETRARYEAGEGR